MTAKLIPLTETIDGEEYERTSTEVIESRSDRGFGRVEFCDKYGSQCSLQDSSLATEPAIWLGVNEVKVQVLDRTKGGGWQEHPLPKNDGVRDVVDNGRMHLTQSMVKALLPYLTHFAETGDYLKIKTPRKR